LEYLRREGKERVYIATVLGNIPNMNQPKVPAYAILLEDIGMETVFKCDFGELDIGHRIRLKVAEVDPRESKIVWTVAN